jgi:hypothetical protein
MNSNSMANFSSGGDAAQALQETVHGLVQEFFEMLGDGEAGNSSFHRVAPHGCVWKCGTPPTEILNPKYLHNIIYLSP